MKFLFKLAIILTLANYLFATPIVDNLTMKKIEKLVQKEEDIAKAYKEYLLTNGSSPTSIQVLITDGFLPKGFNIINPFGETMELQNGEIKKFTNSNIVYNYSINNYYINKNRIYTKSSQNSGNIKINLSFIEKFIFNNSNIITNNKTDAREKYYIENAILSWYDNDRKYQFSIAKDIISEVPIINQTSNSLSNFNSISKLNELLYIGGKIYQLNDKGNLDEFLNLGKKIIKLEKELPPTLITYKNSPNGSGVIINGDIYTWGNNSKKTVSIGINNYTKDNTIGTGTPIINSMLRARAINYEIIPIINTTALNYKTVRICQENHIKCEELYKDKAETIINNLNNENFYSSPTRVKFENIYLDNNKSICAISKDKELYCGGEDVLEKNYIDFIGYEKESNKNIDFLYKSKFFDGKNNFISDILFIDNTYLALGRNIEDGSEVSKLYYWGKDNSNGWAGTGNKTEKNIVVPKIVEGYEFVNIFYNPTYNKIIALGKDGRIYTWGGIKSNLECIQKINEVDINLCKPMELNYRKDIKDKAIEFFAKSIQQKINTIIALGSNEEYYKITINPTTGLSSINLVKDDIKIKSPNNIEDESILSFDYNENGVIWVNSNNKLKGTFTGADDLFTKTINQIAWEKIKVVSPNNGICAIDTNKQMYCWGDLSNTNNDGFVIPIFGSNIQDENKDFIFLEKDGNSITTVTSNNWINNSKYFLKYPTFIGGFNYDIIFK